MLTFYDFSTGAVSAPTADYSYSKLMLSFAGNATNHSDQMVDESIQRLGNRSDRGAGLPVRVNTAGTFPSFENASVSFSGSGAQFAFPSSTFNPGSEHWSISLWAKFHATPLETIQTLFGQWREGGNCSFRLIHNNSTNTLSFEGSSDGTAVSTLASASFTPGSTDLHFLRIEREGVYLRIWNGLEGGSATLLVEANIGSFSFYASTSQLWFGISLNSASAAIDEFRGWIAGVDFYLGATFQHSSASFSVPSARNPRRLSSDPATPVPTYADVVFLIYGDGADGTSASLIDHGPDARTVTKAGDVQADTAISIFGTSVLFDGTGDYMTMPNHADFNVNDTRDFCWEGWFRPAATKIHTFINKRDGSGAEEFSFGTEASNVPQATVFAGSPVGNLLGVTALSTSTTYHLAYTREHTTAGEYLRLFVNGNMVAIAMGTGTPSSNTGVLHIGRDGFNTGRDFNGSGNWFRGTRDDAVYSYDFTPPTPPLPTS